MRTFIDQTGGIATVPSTTGNTLPTADKVIVSQNPKQILDISAYSALDLEFRVFNLSQTNGSSSDSSVLYLETSMQVDDVTTHTLWNPIDPSGINLESIKGTNRVLTFSITEGLARYLRWRIEVPAASSPLTLSAVFQITGFGRS